MKKDAVALTMFNFKFRVHFFSVSVFNVNILKVTFAMVLFKKEDAY